MLTKSDETGGIAEEVFDAVIGFGFLFVAVASKHQIMGFSRAGDNGSRGP